MSTELPIRAVLAALAVSIASCASPAPPAPEAPAPVLPGPSETFTVTRDGWTLSGARQESPTGALLQAVSPVDDRVVWLSGHEGRWLRTEDGGQTWFGGFGPGRDSLQFRDVEGFDAATAYLLSAGTGAASRIYRTDDGGSSWRLQYLADDPAAFLDCMAFWDRDTGVVYGDAVDGSLFVLRTTDGGATWSRVSEVPPAQEGEGGFAASGTCATTAQGAAVPTAQGAAVPTASGGLGWIAAGNAAIARVLVTEDRGLTWRALEPPVVGGAGAGLVTIAADAGRVVALGGELDADSLRGRYVAVSEDGGRTWEPGGELAKTGPAYGSAVVPGTDGRVVVAVGPGGMDWSTDGGRSWSAADRGTRWAVDFAPSGSAGWAVGPGGRVEVLRVTRSGGR